MVTAATEANRQEAAEDWFAAAFHLSFLVARDPIDLELRHRRARAYTKQGLLDKAAADNTAADKLTRPRWGSDAKNCSASSATGTIWIISE
jgi:hypothetical protein